MTKNTAPVSFLVNLIKRFIMINHFAAHHVTLLVDLHDFRRNVHYQMWYNIILMTVIGCMLPVVVVSVMTIVTLIALRAARDSPDMRQVHIFQKKP